jgi:hypothetical protein
MIFGKAGANPDCFAGFVSVNFIHVCTNQNGCITGKPFVSPRPVFAGRSLASSAVSSPSGFSLFDPDSAFAPVPDLDANGSLTISLG